MVYSASKLRGWEEVYAPGQIHCSSTPWIVKFWSFYFQKCNRNGKGSEIDNTDDDKYVMASRLGLFSLEYRQLRSYKRLKKEQQCQDGHGSIVLPMLIPKSGSTPRCSQEPVSRQAKGGDFHTTDCGTPMC